MAGDPMSPEVLVSVRSEMDAAAIVGALAERGIRARAVGGHTSGFRAEAPGDVKVMVARADRAHAEDVLAHFERESAEVDWSHVDFGDGPWDAAEDARDGATSEDGRPWFQFRLATLLALQTVAAVALGAWKSLEGRGEFVAAFSIAYLGLMALTPLLIAAGTIGIAADLNRTRQAWRYVGRAIVLGMVVVAMLFLFARMAIALGVRL